jgi:hypothetical protein
VPFYYTSLLGDNDALRGHAYYFPLRLFDGQRLKVSTQGSLLADPVGGTGERRFTANLSSPARTYLAAVGIADPDKDADTAGLVWMHALAIGYAPTYLSENADGVRQDWPRVPLPNSREALLASAALGREVAALLDTESPVQGVTTGEIRPELRLVGSIRKLGGGQLTPGELAVTAGWGHAGKGGATMPGKGKLVPRDYGPDESAAVAEGAACLGLDSEEAFARLGETTNDVYLNGTAFWGNVPEAVWDYTIGGYQVMKKWLSYRERDLLGRALSLDEVREVTNMARRIAAILLLGPRLDANYRTIRDATYPWPRAGA